MFNPDLPRKPLFLLMLSQERGKLVHNWQILGLSLRISRRQPLLSHDPSLVAYLEPKFNIHIAQNSLHIMNKQEDITAYRYNNHKHKWAFSGWNSTLESLELIKEQFPSFSLEDKEAFIHELLLDHPSCTLMLGGVVREIHIPRVSGVGWRMWCYIYIYTTLVCFGT